MNVLISTLKEELATAKRLELKYLQRIKELPRGSFIARTIHGKQYGYLTFREKGKIKQEYLGSLNKERTNFYKNAMNQRAEYKRKLKNVREQIKIINRALRGKTKLKRAISISLELPELHKAIKNLSKKELKTVISELKQAGLENILA